MLWRHVQDYPILMTDLQEYGRFNIIKQRKNPRILPMSTARISIREKKKNTNLHSLPTTYSFRRIWFFFFYVDISYDKIYQWILQWHL